MPSEIFEVSTGNNFMTSSQSNNLSQCLSQHKKSYVRLENKKFLIKILLIAFNSSINFTIGK